MIVIFLNETDDLKESLMDDPIRRARFSAKRAKYRHMMAVRRHQRVVRRTMWNKIRANINGRNSRRRARIRAKERARKAQSRALNVQLKPKKLVQVNLNS